MVAYRGPVCSPVTPSPTFQTCYKPMLSEAFLYRWPLLPPLPFPWEMMRLAHLIHCGSGLDVLASVGARGRMREAPVRISCQWSAPLSFRPLRQRDFPMWETTLGLAPSNATHCAGNAGGGAWWAALAFFPGFEVQCERCREVCLPSARVPVVRALKPANTLRRKWFCLLSFLKNNTGQNPPPPSLVTSFIYDCLTCPGSSSH